MPSMVNGNLVGAKELVKQLKELGKMEDGKALRSAVRAGFKPTLEAARANIPVGTRSHLTYKGRRVDGGYAKSTLRMITKLSKDKQKAAAIIGVRKEAYYVVQYLELYGQYGRPPKPWLRPAFYSTRGEQQRGVVEDLRKSVKRILKRNKKQGASAQITGRAGRVI